MRYMQTSCGQIAANTKDTMPDRRSPTEREQGAAPGAVSATAAPVGPAPARAATPGNAVPPAETPGASGLLTLWIGVVIVAALYFAREVLVPITLAVLLSFLLAPLVHLLRLIHLGRDFIGSVRCRDRTGGHPCIGRV